MRLDVVHLSRLYAGLAVGLVEHGFLCRSAWRGQTVGMSVLIGRASSDHRIDVIAVGLGLPKRLEHDNASPLASNITIGPCIERSALAVRGKKTQFGKVFDNLG